MNDAPGRTADRLAFTGPLRGYVERLPLAADESRAVLGELRHASDAQQAFAGVHRMLSGKAGNAEHAADASIAVLPYHGRQPLEVAMLVLFAVLFGWISAGFWTAIAGFVLLLLGGDRHAISRTAAAAAPVDPAARVAVVMPIRNENVARVFAG